MVIIIGLSISVIILIILLIAVWSTAAGENINGKEDRLAQINDVIAEICNENYINRKEKKGR